MPDQPDLALVRLLEDCCFNAWPTATTVFLDGWVVRLDGGHVYWNNSASPLHPRSMPQHELITRVENLFRVQDLAPVFRLSPLAPPDLDAALDKRGWDLHEPSVVMRAAQIAGDAEHASIRNADSADPAWIAGAMTAYGHGAEGIAALTRLLANLALPAAFITVVEDGRAIGWAMGVAERGHIGLHDVVVDPAARRRGIGRRLVAGLLAYGRAQGASAAYLQIREDDAVARQLYAPFGFEEVYRTANRMLLPGD